MTSILGILTYYKYVEPIASDGIELADNKHFVKIHSAKVSAEPMPISTKIEVVPAVGVAVKVVEEGAN